MLKRAGDPEEIAGATIVVDGGQIIIGPKPS